MIWIRISDPRSFRSQCIKGANESTLGKDASVSAFIYYYPTDLGSLILTQIIPKECTLTMWTVFILMHVLYIFSMRDFYMMVRFLHVMFYSLGTHSYGI